MEYREIVKQIPKTVRGVLSEKLVDCLLEAKDGGNVPSSLAKTILYYWQRDQLASEAGLINVIKGATLADPEKTEKIMQDFGLDEIVLALRQT